MLFGETVAVYCENHTEHVNTLRGVNLEISNIEACGTYSNHCALRGLSPHWRSHSPTHTIIALETDPLFHPRVQSFTPLVCSFVYSCLARLLNYSLQPFTLLHKFTNIAYNPRPSNPHLLIKSPTDNFANFRPWVSAMQYMNCMPIRRATLSRLAQR
jgi:hypothetical protein